MDTERRRWCPGEDLGMVWKETDGNEAAPWGLSCARHVSLVKDTSHDRSWDERRVDCASDHTRSSRPDEATIHKMRVRQWEHISPFITTFIVAGGYYRGVWAHTPPSVFAGEGSGSYIRSTHINVERRNRSRSWTLGDYPRGGPTPSLGTHPPAHWSWLVPGPRRAG